MLPPLSPHCQNSREKKTKKTNKNKQSNKNEQTNKRNKQTNKQIKISHQLWHQNLWLWTVALHIIKVIFPHIQMKSWAVSVSSYMPLFKSKFCIAFSISFFINFGIVYTWPKHQSSDKRICFKIFFFHLKDSCTLFQWLILFFLSGSYQEQNYQNVPQWKIVTILFALFYQFYFHIFIFICDLEASYSFGN